MRREEQAIVFIKAGQLPMEGQGDGEGLEINHDNRNEKMAAVNKGIIKQEGGRKRDEGNNSKE